MNKAVVLFDGVCNFCNASVNFIIDRDKNDYFRFASLQSEDGIKILYQFGLDSTNLTTLILVEGEKYFVKSSAALRIAGRLKFPWNLFAIFLVIPPFIRNPVYDLIAHNRYKWLGKRDACRIP
ncbi:MAG: DCC1-like thiol-disulfide oxidoreductase family protein, partial [Ignavibacteria bacterium]|nr:DCC1-like thiol-disulfide oxidoreductase family protein [Ignavibacteria bacterium]